jgi:hypothetical protein
MVTYAIKSTSQRVMRRDSFRVLWTPDSWGLKIKKLQKEAFRFIMDMKWEWMKLRKNSLSRDDPRRRSFEAQDSQDIPTNHNAKRATLNRVDVYGENLKTVIGMIAGDTGY